MTCPRKIGQPNRGLIGGRLRTGLEILLKMGLEILLEMSLLYGGRNSTQYSVPSGFLGLMQTGQANWSVSKIFVPRCHVLRGLRMGE